MAGDVRESRPDWAQIGKKKEEGRRRPTSEDNKGLESDEPMRTAMKGKLEAEEDVEEEEASCVRYVLMIDSCFNWPIRAARRGHSGVGP